MKVWFLCAKLSHSDFRARHARLSAPAPYRRPHRHGSLAPSIDCWLFVLSSFHLDSSNLFSFTLTSSSSPRFSKLPCCLSTSSHTPIRHRHGFQRCGDMPASSDETCSPHPDRPIQIVGRLLMPGCEMAFKALRTEGAAALFTESLGGCAKIRSSSASHISL